MSTRTRKRLKVGDHIDGAFTVMGAVDDGGADPIHLVWSHEAWCPMVLKTFRSKERGEQESALLARLAHPGIVRHLGRTAGGGLLMEHLEGPTLRHALRAAPCRQLALGDALRIAVHVGAALAFMHGRDVVHLDVKPRNIIVQRGRPILIDLGAARRREDWALDVLEGTDEYMAPEQCRREPVSPASDVFGLASVLHEMLAGERPFPEGTKAVPFPQLAEQPASLAALRPEVPDQLCSLLAGCLAREPAARPALPDLMVAMNAAIGDGAPMWPAGFDPRMPAAAPTAADGPSRRRGSLRTAAKA
jgi:serine/threonine protein kinase